MSKYNERDVRTTRNRLLRDVKNVAVDFVPTALANLEKFEALVGERAPSPDLGTVTRCLTIRDQEFPWVLAGIRLLRALFGYDLKTAKELVDRAQAGSYFQLECTKVQHEALLSIFQDA